MSDKEEAEIIEMNSNDDIPEPEVETQEPEASEQVAQRFVYFISKITVAYKRDNQMRSRSVNVVVRSDTGQINRHLLNSIQNNAMARVVTENKVREENLRDVLVDNISILGQFTEDEFMAEGGQTISMGPEDNSSQNSDAPEPHMEAPERKH